MKTILLALPLFILSISCKMGETDKKIQIHEREELDNIKLKKKHNNDTTVIIDTVRN